MRMKEYKSLSDYLAWSIRPCCRNQYFDSRVNSYYRGQSNAAWKLTPRMFREKKDNGTISSFIEEKELLMHVDYFAWEYLRNCGSRLEQLILLQHYGLATRLLDVTRNPLVALFFACHEEMDENGCVFRGNASADDISIANRYADIMYEKMEYNYPSSSKQEIANFLGIKCEMIDAYCCPILLPHIKTNQRVNVQSGLFLMPPILQKDPYRPSLYTFTRPPYDFEGKKFSNKIPVFNRSRIIIPARKKLEILRQIDTLGINEYTIYQDFEHLLHYLNTEPYKDQI